MHHRRTHASAHGLATGHRALGAHRAASYGVEGRGVVRVASHGIEAGEVHHASSHARRAARRASHRPAHASIHRAHRHAHATAISHGGAHASTHAHCSHAAHATQGCHSTDGCHAAHGAHAHATHRSHASSHSHAAHGTRTHVHAANILHHALAASIGTAGTFRLLAQWFANVAVLTEGAIHDAVDMLNNYWNLPVSILANKAMYSLCLFCLALFATSEECSFLPLQQRQLSWIQPILHVRKLPCALAAAAVRLSTIVIIA